MNSSPVAEQLLSGSWGAVAVSVGVLGWIALNYGPLPVLLCLVLIGILVAFSLSSTLLIKSNPSSKLTLGITISVLGGAALIITIYLMLALSRERDGGKIILHVRQGFPLPERVEVFRDFPNFLGFLRKPIELELGDGQDGCRTFSARVSLGKWRIAANPGYQEQTISIPSNDPTFEDHIIFAKILDGRPDKTEDQISENSGGTKIKSEDKTEPTATEAIDLPSPSQDPAPTSAGSTTGAPKATTVQIEDPTDQARNTREISHVDPKDVNSFQDAPEDIQAHKMYAKALRNSRNFERQGDWTAAIQELVNFIERFPNSPEAEDARRLKSELLKKGGE